VPQLLGLTKDGDEQQREIRRRPLTMTTFATSETIAAKRASVLASMISNLRRGEDRKYYVGLVKYYIEGTPYFASGLSVDLTTTFDICQTDAGFACIAMFPPEILQTDIVKANGIEKINVGGQTHDIVRVRLEVMLDDIWSVAEFIDGQQHDLLLDTETLKSGLGGNLNKLH
jgi:hypothetical protein